MIILDTHVLIWWISDPTKLSPKALIVIEKEIKDGSILVSSISVWELYMLIKKDRLKLTMETDSWLGKIESLPFVQFVPVDNQIALKSVNLPGDFHADPADRMIVATAREKGINLITSDEKIHNYPYVQYVW